MISEFYSSAHGLLKLQPGLPQDFKGPFISGSKQQHFIKEDAFIVLQEIQERHFHLRFFIFRFLKKVSISSRIKSGFQTLLAAKGNTRCHISSKQKLTLREFQYVLLNGEEEDWKLEFKNEKPLHLICTYWSDDWIKELTTDFPSVLPTIKNERTAIKGPFGSNEKIKEIVHELLHASFAAEKLPRYFKFRLEDYLFHLLENASGAESIQLVANPWEMDAVYRVKDQILEDILVHYSIVSLARKHKMKASRLKVFFKREFGMGPYEFLLNARIERAKQLMEQGLNMKVAAPMAGYRTSSFVVAFKRKYGITPMKFFRKR